LERRAKSIPTATKRKRTSQYKGHIRWWGGQVASQVHTMSQSQETFQTVPKYKLTVRRIRRKQTFVEEVLSSPDDSRRAKNPVMYTFSGTIYFHLRGISEVLFQEVVQPSNVYKFPIRLGRMHRLPHSSHPHLIHPAT